MNNSPFSFTKIINGLINTIEITNRSLPIIKTASNYIPKVSTFISNLNINKNDNNNLNTKITNNKQIEIKKESVNRPTFFQ